MTDFMWFIVSGDLIKCNLFLWETTDNRKRAQQKLLPNVRTCVCSYTLVFLKHFQLLS